MSYNQLYDQDSGENVSYNNSYRLDVNRRNTLLPVIKSTAPNWSIIPSETNISRAEPHYGTVDALSMSVHGRMIIVGSFETNKAYLYNDNLDLIHTFEGSDRFGIRCSIDDSGSIIVIASNTHLYIYEGAAYEVVKIIALPYGGGPSASPWNMKISKDGSTIIASNNVGSSSFEAWTTSDKWSTVNGSVIYSSSNSQRVSAIDLSMNGSVMIASGFDGTTEGYVHLFFRGTTTPVDNLIIPGEHNIVIGQSVALSGDGKKVIVGAPGLMNNVSGSARVYFIDIVGTTMDPPVSKTFSSTTNARYGRSVSIDYDGRYAMVSGSMSEYRYAPSVGDNANGSAMVIDTSTYTIARELPKTSLNYQAGATYELMFNGYGIHCKLSNQGGVAAVSGGGYAFLFKI
jgi:WD40 repeat protein